MANPIYNIVCLGSGYTAGVTMIHMAFQCHNVIIRMFDVDDDNIDEWIAGEVPFEEPDMEYLLNQVRNIRFMVGYSEDLEAALHGADFVVMAIDNPIKRIGREDVLNLTKWGDSWKAVANHAPGRLVIEKSNVPLDADQVITTIFRKNGALVDPSVVYNPEFFSLGRAIMDLWMPTQVIFGGTQPIIQGQQFILFRQLLVWLDDGIVFTTPDSKSVILAKMGINVLLASKVSTLNSIASVSSKVGANMDNIMEIMLRDQRLGPAYLRPGIGFGGPSLTRDTQIFSQIANDHGLTEEKQLYVKLMENNVATKKRFVNMVLAKLVGLTNRVIAIFGFAIKPDVSNLTNSPALEICNLLLNHQVQLQIHDPDVSEVDILGCFGGRARHLVVATDTVEAARDATAICILHDRPAYHNAQLYTQLYPVMTHPSYIFDGIHLDITWDQIIGLGFSVHAVGKPSKGLGY